MKLEWPRQLTVHPGYLAERAPCQQQLAVCIISSANLLSPTPPPNTHSHRQVTLPNPHPPPPGQGGSLFAQSLSLYARGFESDARDPQSTTLVRG
ncbi:hypothetical protein ElyMa_000057200 [Elysia marginata]|uniref:Uncharacterized protein n=1 Tax=Elysia marginata TaxID=1093978 RepID=A0AAV4EG16_9GAST|nr:hypothetical protein ElyMa_000057200 [Elysia marginata]